MMAAFSTVDERLLRAHLPMRTSVVFPGLSSDAAALERSITA